MSADNVGWISWFCGLKGNEFFCEVDEDFIQDSFNLNGLEEKVHHFREAFNTILDIESKELEESDSSSETRETSIEEAAKYLYGLIHARYITTTRGILQMLEKYINGDFGNCPRVFCKGQTVLPIGLTDTPGQSMVNIYCPRCMDVYVPRFGRQCQIDGAFFGLRFPHMLFMVFPEYRPKPPDDQFTATLYGFKIHPHAYQLQREANYWSLKYKGNNSNENEKKSMENV